MSVFDQYKYIFDFLEITENKKDIILNIELRIIYEELFSERFEKFIYFKNVLRIFGAKDYKQNNDRGLYCIKLKE